MRIALVSHEYPPFRGGGIGTYATVMADAFAAAGHEVHVLTNRFDYGSTDPIHGKSVHRDGNLWVHRIEAVTDQWLPRPPHHHDADTLGQLHRYWSPYLYYAEMVAERLDAICREYDIEVAEFPECAAEGYSVLRRRNLRLGFTSLPITVTLHSPIWEIYQYNLYSRHNAGFHRRSYMEDECIRLADMVNSPSALLSRIVYKRLGLADGQPPCDVMPLPMDFSSIPTSLPGPATNEDPTLLFVGRLEPRKGVRYLVDAAVRVMAEHPRLRVQLIGRDCDAGEAPGSMTEFLKARIPPRLRDNFEFLGSMPRDTLFARYASATACVFAAPWDNFPLTCMEAMACNSCVIASDYTGMAEMIEHERSGLLFPARDVGALADTITRVLENPDLAASIRRHAAPRIRSLCDPATAVNRRIEHYQRVIDRRASALASRTISVPAEPADSRPRLSVYIPNHTSAEGIARSVTAVRESAQRADVDLDIAIVGTPQWHTLASPLEGTAVLSAESAEPDAARRLWLARARETNADYLLQLWPWEQIEPTYLASCLEVMRSDATAAWVTSWALPVDGTVGQPYAGYDFSTPLEIIEYHPVPLALIRREALERVGGLNHELPAGWSQWDLWLALHEAGLRGVVIPYWLARYVPRMEYTLERPGTHEIYTTMLDTITARSPQVFARHATDLWLFAVLSAAMPGATFAGPAAPHETKFDDWWVMTKKYLKRRWPSSAKAFRRYVKGRPI